MSYFVVGQETTQPMAPFVDENGNPSPGRFRRIKKFLGTTWWSIHSAKDYTPPSTAKHQPSITMIIISHEVMLSEKYGHHVGSPWTSFGSASTKDLLPGCGETPQVLTRYGCMTQWSMEGHLRWWRWRFMASTKRIASIVLEQGMTATTGNRWLKH